MYNMCYMSNETLVNNFETNHDICFVLFVFTFFFLIFQIDDMIPFKLGNVLN